MTLPVPLLTRASRRPARRPGAAPGLAALLALCAFLVPPLVPGSGTARAQETGDVRVGFRYDPGYVPALVMPRPEGDSELAAVASQVDDILRRDLAFSDRFEMLPVPDSVDRASGIRYGLWNELGAVWLVQAEVSGSPDGPRLRVSLHDVVYRNLRDVQAFTLPSPGDPGFRMAVHRVSDRLVEWATGEPGMAASRIAFRRKSGDGASDVWMVDSDGQGLRRLTTDSSIVYSPSLHPSGDRLLYVSYVDGRPAVYERNLSAGRTRVVSDRPGVNLTPAYHPDGERLMLARTAGNGTEVFELEASPPWSGRQVTSTSNGDALNPTYAPDGRRFAYEATPLGEQQIYVRSVDGGEPRLVSKYVYGERGQAAAPDWSPTGERIAYQAWMDGQFQVVTVNPDGSDRRILTTEGNNEEPAWAPDGRHLVFRSTREGYHALWVLDTVSGRLRRLVANHVDQMPDWSASLGSVGNP